MLPFTSTGTGLSAFLTREARQYAVHALARRAGVSEELFDTWRIETGEQQTVIYLEPNSSKKIIFPLCSGRIASGSERTVTASWFRAPNATLQKLIPSFVVPFVGGGKENDDRPVFAMSGPDAAQFNFDLPTAAIWTLTRVEETLLPARDQHGRFPAAASVAVIDGFLERPIVDEYGFALEQALQCLLPRWQPQRSPLRVKLSHDLDELGIPFSLRSSLGHALRRGKPSAALRDFRSLATGENPAYLACVFDLASLSAEHDLDSAFYWKASRATRADSGYDPRHPKIQKTMDWLSEHGFENGVHPGYETFESTERLSLEIGILQQCLRTGELGGRQHYLRWNPGTWSDWENLGLQYDSSVGFAELVGFRAGTCIPYCPWLFAQNRPAALLEIPLTVMDRTLGYYMNLTEDQSNHAIAECAQRCEVVGGVFAMLWHNDAMLDRRYGNVYRRALEKLAGSARFDWKAERQRATLAISQH